MLQIARVSCGKCEQMCGGETLNMAEVGWSPQEARLICTRGQRQALKMHVPSIDLKYYLASRSMQRDMDCINSFPKWLARG